MNPKTFKACLAVIVFTILALLLLSSPLLRVNKAVGMISGVQEKGGVVAPKPKPTPKPTPSQPTSRNPSKSSDRSAPRQTQCVAYPPTSGTGREYSEDLNGVKLEMVEIPAGNFCMGSPDGLGESEEHRQHRVTVQSFYMAKYEVTQRQYQAVMGTNPSEIKGDNLPVEKVSWNDAKEFCRRLSQVTEREYRLPSEAEWEYACRAGTTTAFAFGDSLSSEQANFNGNEPYGGAAKGVWREKPTPVGSFRPNAFGLYDMHGNVDEWCEDWYRDTYYGAPTDGSALKNGGGRYRVLRGGSWLVIGNALRSAFRGFSVPGGQIASVGFRVVSGSRSS